MSAATQLLVAVLGAAVLTVGYFTLPLDKLDDHHRALSWAVLGGLLTVMACGTVILTWRALTVESGHPGLGILLLSWAALLTFAASYKAMSTSPGQFHGSLNTRVDALYFTVITLATVGYGDISPSGQTARCVVMVQLFYSFVFLAAGVTAVTNRTRRKLMARLGLSDGDGDRDERRGRA